MTPKTSILLTIKETLFGIDTMTEVEQAAFLDEVGGIVMESALLRYLTELEPAAQQDLEAFIAEHADAEEFLDTLSAEHPRFAELLTEEIAAFKEEAQAVLG